MKALIGEGTCRGLFLLWYHRDPSFEALLWWHLRMSVCPQCPQCPRQPSPARHSGHGTSPSPGRQCRVASASQAAEILIFVCEAFTVLRAAQCLVITRSPALSVCPVVSHQFPHYSATYGWYQICIYAILWDFPISMFPTFRQLRHADSIFSSDGDWETESREYKLNELRLRLLQKIQKQTDWSEVFILSFQMFHLVILISHTCRTIIGFDGLFHKVHIVSILL